ncbi:hypothetical protein B296_00000135 [Ensete ventricosum]|uniref:Uncharacterized protein n=1 Tax=Ensete ventricosum TaxID=4639 RepID=A0A427B6V5_ENSVE|nr:hypothetical protein B296_00000135 [Ensete ventricosum]
MSSSSGRGAKGLVRSPTLDVGPEAELVLAGTRTLATLVPFGRGLSRTRVTSCNPQLSSSVDPPEEHPWTESTPSAQSPSHKLGSGRFEIGPQSRRAAPVSR